ncbi:NAD(+) diphosphatase [Aureimonas pseudogalii]|uniref:NAD(+) diphosphatase n=1 Tax=Aureimonas pseudogalii TaxID=1744844 RepID=A0A7W6E845_9HYPH|nr:NAD(+) diphosphatase [Aureimonas pseudogalii]MBB3996487.1 NAD+ diphosphatase [Aureimonas pseudogalii]
MTAPDLLRLGYAHNRLRRDGETRTDESLAEALAEPRARVALQAGGLWLCRGSADAPEPYFTVGEAQALLGSGAVELLLGHTEAGEPRLAAALPSDRAESGSEPDWPGAPRSIAGHNAFDLRTLGMRELLDPSVEGELAQAAHLLNWHAQTRFCGRCGGETRIEAAGFRRKCTRCDHLVFPRTDPVSIMLVHDGEGRALMGRQPRFPAQLWSCLAGFIEAGETLEDAVRRETAEEAGIEVGAVRYHSSQPWPFPGSLMIGCTARALTREIRFDATELEDCRWFERAELADMLAGTHPDELAVPPRYAIAHHLIRAFVMHEIEADNAEKSENA